MSRAAKPTVSNRVYLKVKSLEFRVKNWLPRDQSVAKRGIFPQEPCPQSIVKMQPKISAM